MTQSLDKLPKAVKALPEEAHETWVNAYNQDFGWRCSEAHAEKAAWRIIKRDYQATEDGSWVRK